MPRGICESSQNTRAGNFSLPLHMRAELDSRLHLPGCSPHAEQSPDSEPPSTMPPPSPKNTHTKKPGPTPQREVISRYTNPHNLPAQQKPTGQFQFPVPPLSTRPFQIKCPIITQFPVKTHGPTSSLADNSQRPLSTAQDSGTTLRVHFFLWGSIKQRAIAGLPREAPGLEARPWLHKCCCLFKAGPLPLVVHLNLNQRSRRLTRMGSGLKYCRRIHWVVDLSLPCMHLLQSNPLVVECLDLGEGSGLIHLIEVSKTR